jgi:VIT1/CCC1 family predicted Fe2+/Mn2+ transporter
MNVVDTEIRDAVMRAQKNEITEYVIYEMLARSVRDPGNKKILQRIAKDELKHYDFGKKYTGEDVKPNRLKVWFYFLIARLFGITFGIKLMERAEEEAQKTYARLSPRVPEVEEIIIDENEHEQQLIALIDEERLIYVGSIVLGLNDALVELTGALAGFTLALQSTRLIAVTGFITGIAASLSMAASEYLSKKAEGGEQNPLRAAVYTGVAYIMTVLFLIFPYLIFTNYYVCLGFALVNAIIVIVIFNFYVSVAKDISFKKRFLEMALISLGVAAVSFGIGYLVRIVLRVEI